MLKNVLLALMPGRQIYIHCRGGHGRSGMVAAMVLIAVKNVTPQEALKMVKDAHSKRKVMDEKWRKMGAPQTKSQKDFVLNYDYSKISPAPVVRFFSGKAKDIDKSYEIFSNFAAVSVTIDEKRYPTTEHYFQAMKFPDSEYAEKIRLAETPLIAKRLGKSRNYPIREGWNLERIDVMREALKAKAEQNKAFREKLIETKGALLIEASPFDSFWGEGRAKKGKNMLGVLLMELRESLLV